MKKLNKKVAIITGGAQGLGYEMVKLFSDEGAIVIAVDVQDFTLGLKNVETYQLDITDAKKVEAFFHSQEML